MRYTADTVSEERTFPIVPLATSFCVPNTCLPILWPFVDYFEVAIDCGYPASS